MLKDWKKWRAALNYELTLFDQYNRHGLSILEIHELETLAHYFFSKKKDETGQIFFDEILKRDKAVFAMANKSVKDCSFFCSQTFAENYRGGTLEDNVSKGKCDKILHDHKKHIAHLVKLDKEQKERERIEKENNKTKKGGLYVIKGGRDHF